MSRQSTDDVSSTRMIAYLLGHNKVFGAAVISDEVSCKDVYLNLIAAKTGLHSIYHSSDVLVHETRFLYCSHRV